MKKKMSEENQLLKRLEFGNAISPLPNDSSQMKKDLLNIKEQVLAGNEAESIIHSAAGQRCLDRLDRATLRSVLSPYEDSSSMSEEEARQIALADLGEFGSTPRT